MDPIIENLNMILENPTIDNIFTLFDVDGYIRFNMIYVSPLSLRHFKEKLIKLGIQNWMFGENELVFKLREQVVKFKGKLTITFKHSTPLQEKRLDKIDNLYLSGSNIGPNTRNSEPPKIFALELDFDPIVASDTGVSFLEEVEIFLKQCDACFFMTYFISIDNEILSNSLSKSIEFLSQRK